MSKWKDFLLCRRSNKIKQEPKKEPVDPELVFIDQQIIKLETIMQKDRTGRFSFIINKENVQELSR